MSKKDTIEEVRKAFEKERYTLLTREYINNKQKLEYVCPKGHTGTVIWSNWKRGYRCAECGGTKKLTIEFIKQEFEKEGYELLTTTYKNAHQNLEYICPRGHREKITWSDWQQRHRCGECAGVRKKDITFIRTKFEKENYKLLTTTYKNSSQKLEYVCKMGHKSSITWSTWQQGKRCGKCAGNKRKDIEFIRQEFEKENYKLLTTTYKNNSQKLKYTCPKGHNGTVRWSNWSQGERCSKCAIIRKSGTNAYQWKNYTKKEIKQFYAYKANVVQITNQNFCKYYCYVNPLKLPRSHKLYHVDHIYSIRSGFDNKIPPEVIASPINLQMLSATKNHSKYSRSDMTKEMLYYLYYQFEKEIKEYEG